jgi:hypothetical protein
MAPRRGRLGYAFMLLGYAFMLLGYGFTNEARSTPAACPEAGRRAVPSPSQASRKPLPPPPNPPAAPSQPT